MRVDNGLGVESVVYCVSRDIRSCLENASGLQGD